MVIFLLFKINRLLFILNSVFIVMFCVKKKCSILIVCFLFFQYEVETLLQNLAKQRAGSIEIGHFLCSAVSNVVCSLLMSVRFGHDDPRFIRFMNLIDEGFRLFTVTAVASFIPILRYLPGFNYAYNKIRQVSIFFLSMCSFLYCFLFVFYYWHELVVIVFFFLYAC